MKCVTTDFYSGNHRPYRNILRGSVTDEQLSKIDVLDTLILESGAIDGDEIEITVRRTGQRPFGDRKVRLVKPHTYEREKSPVDFTDE